MPAKTFRVSDRGQGPYPKDSQFVFGKVSFSGAKHGGAVASIWFGDRSLELLQSGVPGLRAFPAGESAETLRMESGPARGDTRGCVLEILRSQRDSRHPLQLRRAVDQS